MAPSHQGIKILHTFYFYNLRKGEGERRLSSELQENRKAMMQRF